MGELTATAIGVAGLAYAAFCIRRSSDSLSARRSIGALADLVIFISLLLVTALVLGSFALFKPLPIAITGIGFGLISDWWTRRNAPPRSGFGCDLDRVVVTAGRMPFVLAAVATALVIFAWSGEIGRSLGEGIYLQDSTWYHLPFSAGFAQDGRIGELQITDPMKLVAWFYPQNSEVLHAYGLVAFGNEFGSLFLNLVFALATMLAAWATICRGSKREWAVVFVAVLLLTPTLVIQSGNAPNDIASLAFLAISIALLGESHSRGEARRLDGPLLFVAGLAAGLAIGTKLTMLVPVAVISVGVLLTQSRPELKRNLLIWFSALFATGGYWYLRNLVISGNPLPWIGVGPFPSVDQPGIYPRPANSVVDYLKSPSDFFAHLLPGVDDALGYAWPVLVAGALVGVYLLLTARRQNFRMALGVAAIATSLTYIFNPISASGEFGYPTGFASNLRYVAPALYIGLIGLALHLEGFKATTMRWIGALALFALAATFLSSFDPGLKGMLVGLVLTATVFAFYAALAHRGVDARVRRILLGLATIILIGSGSIAFASYSSDRYAPERIPADRLAGFRSSEAWARLQEWGLKQRDSTIAITGPAATFGQYSFYGEDLSNRVEYLGVPIANGGLRPARNCEETRERVNATGTNFVVSTPLRTSGKLTDSQEAFWLRDDPKVTEILRASPASVFRIDGRLDPALCYFNQAVRMVPNLWGGSSPIDQTAVPLSSDP